MNRLTIQNIVAVLLLVIASPAFAQQRQHVSYKTSSENTKYVQQLNVEVGDVPNTLFRVFDLHRNTRRGPHHQCIEAYRGIGPRHGPRSPRQWSPRFMSLCLRERR